MKKYLERGDDVLPATNKSTDSLQTQKTTRNSQTKSLKNMQLFPLREQVRIGPGEYTQSDDTICTMGQSDSTTLRQLRVKRLPYKFQDLSCLYLSCLRFI